MRNLWIYLPIFLFLGCKELDVKDWEVFSYDEYASHYGTPADNQRNWNFSCEKLNCTITYALGTPLKTVYRKEVQLGSEEEKRQIAQQILKGMKNGKDYKSAQDFQPRVRLVVNQKTVYERETQNEEFFKILNRLLDRPYEEILHSYKNDESSTGN